MIAAAEFVFVCNRVDDRIQAVNIGSHADRLRLNPRIDFRYGLDLRVDRLCVPGNLLHEICNRLDAKIDPAAEIRIGKIAELQIFLGVEPRLLPECRHGVVVKAGPCLLPAVEMRHPVRNVDVDAINARRGDLPDPLHVRLAPRRGVGSDPHILISFGNPKRGAATKDCGLAVDLAL